MMNWGSSWSIRYPDLQFTTITRTAFQNNLSIVRFYPVNNIWNTDPISFYQWIKTLSIINDWKIYSSFIFIDRNSGLRSSCVFKNVICLFLYNAVNIQFQLLQMVLKHHFVIKLR